MKKFKFTIFILLFCVSPILSASTCESGSQYLELGELKRAFNIFKLGALSKDGCSQYYLSIMYQNGHYVKQSDKKAQKYLKRSMKNGFVPTSELQSKLED